MALIGQAVSEEKMFENVNGRRTDGRRTPDPWVSYKLTGETSAQVEFLYVHELGPGSRNDLDFQYSHTLNKSISCLYLPTFRSQASIVSEKSFVFTFSYRKA